MSALSSTWRSLWRFHRVLAGILVLEYALAFFILLTALGVLIARAEAINQTSGMREQGLYILFGCGINRPLHRFEMFDARTQFAARVGEKHAAVLSSVPFLGRFSQQVQISVAGDPHHPVPLQANAYQGGTHLSSVLGLRLLHGRWFKPGEITRRHGDKSHLVVLSESLAKRLFHGDKAVGKQVSIVGQMHTVVGVTNPLAAPQYLGSRRTTYTLLLPKIPSGASPLGIRYSGPMADLQAVLSNLRKHAGGEVDWSLVPYASLRARYFRSDRLTVAALSAVVVAVLLTALCGILGLTNYWVAKRRPQIATRRALGARKRDVLVHFLIETELLVAAGLALGVVLKLFVDVFFVNLRVHGGIATWVLSIVLVLLLAMLVVCASLRRWLRMIPADLMRWN